MTTTTDTTPTPTDEPSAASPTPEEVQAAIERENALVQKHMADAQLGFVQQRVLELSVQVARLEAENATLRAAAAEQPAT